MENSFILDNVNILSEQVLSSPEQIKKEIKMPERLKEFIFLERNAISRIIHRHDKRLLVICGPCSIHEMKAAMEYAERITELRKKYAKTLNIVMRSYFEKPRTTVGWKGYINDPHKDGNENIIGIMLESHLFEGNQSSDIPKEELKYGVSITDACIGWDTTEDVLAMCHESMSL
ncbi:hypothetical protein [Legionella shakespearei]|uniref:3-deoxy-7-phosphoheptulonate synthase n=1 Tax=Legionella shakespearei DSM 23087 TaxID=1122169 RepID=A0A0W0YN42_9GAMM|nr:hypothetical protein [Legionella shakespearei]KTD58143.1 phospho-2-dehydro-3-deoxyheptonate aldolase [Legionella shakespearei DSM 23087]